jgi:transcriptional regulator with XRE-family HTH domain
VSVPKKPKNIDALGQAIGQRLVAVRKQVEESGTEVINKKLAAHLGLKAASMIGMYESGERKPAIDKLYGLAEFYRVRVYDLLPPHRDGESKHSRLSDIYDALPPASKQVVRAVAEREKYNLDLAAGRITEEHEQHKSGRGSFNRRKEHSTSASILPPIPVRDRSTESK